jgi:hypothetical protein
LPKRDSIEIACEATSTELMTHPAPIMTELTSE